MIAQERSETNESLSQSTIFDVLSSRRRRAVLRLLRETDESLDLTALTEQIAADEVGVSVDDLPSQARKRVYVSLYQTHIPRLEDVGLVEYDSDTGIVTRTELATAIDPYLTEDISGRHWAPYYLLLAVLGGSALAAAWIDFGVNPWTVMVVFVAALLILVGLHAWTARRAGAGLAQPKNEERDQSSDGEAAGNN
jgi:hypothetical protein